MTTLKSTLSSSGRTSKVLPARRDVLWAEYDCAESNNEVVVGKGYDFPVWRGLPDAYARGSTAARHAVIQDSEVAG
jgi:hypothetical protein